MRTIEEYLREDVGFGDITTDALVGDEQGKARIRVSEDCVLAGLEEAEEVFRLVGVQTRSDLKDGESVRRGTVVLELEGPIKGILKGERLALNFLMRMSGIATTTYFVAQACCQINPQVRVAATRKTTPGFRFYEKKAVILGGGDPHRYRLDDAILIKDNHLKVVGSIRAAVMETKKVSFTKKVEVEVESLEDAEEAARAGADIIMLDNMTPELAEACAQAIRNEDPRILVEASGGISPEKAPLYAKSADVISLGWLTHSVRSVQFSLDVL